MKKFSILLLVCFIVACMVVPARAASHSLTVQNDKATFDFPNTVTFSARLKADSVIQSVVLEYGTGQLTCGQVIAKAFPEFSPDSTVDVSWTWDMRQSGSLPPGASLWWRWRVTDANGNVSVSDQNQTTWLDNTYSWKVLADGSLRLHWYEGDNNFARQLMDAAKGGLALNQKSAGLKPDGVIDMYIYANYDDLGAAVLYEPSWTGGQAFPQHNIVIIGIAPDNLVWGKRTIVHELTHVLVGHLTFSCLGDVPTWLNEGLAVYSEGDLESDSQSQLDEAIRQDQLMSVRALSGGFSEVRDKATLSYSQSYSIVKFLIETYGQDKMTGLLTTLRDGTTLDDALQKVYGFDVDGLDAAWRVAVGAKSHGNSPNPTAQPTPTIIPTIIPVSGAPVAVTPTPLAIPTSSFDGSNNQATATPLDGSNVTPDWFLIGSVVMLCLCCLVVLGIIAVIIFVVVRKGGRRENNL